jgi:GNAT superfamily N-acetyltransferase
MDPPIGLATLADVEELARLRWQLYAEDTAPVVEPFDAFVERFADFARAALADERWRAWIAEDAGRLVGALWRFCLPRVPQPGRGEPQPLAYVTNVYVEPAYRNDGLGARLLDRAIEASRAEGCSLVMVWPSDRSGSFYRRAGFERGPDPLVLDLGGPWRHGTAGDRA